MSLPGDFISSLYLAPYTLKKGSMTMMECNKAKSKRLKRRCGRID